MSNLPAVMSDDTLIQLLRGGGEIGPFKPGKISFTVGEFEITDIVWEDVPHYASEINDNMTLYKAMDDHRVIGVRVYEQSKGNNGKSNG